MRKYKLLFLGLLLIPAIAYAQGVPGLFDGRQGGAAALATALAANGANCAANTFPAGVDASGAVESCSAVALAGLATQATNTVVGNATSGTAVPTALSVGSCSTAGSALIWTTNTGFGCNTAVNATTATVADAASDTTTFPLLSGDATGSKALLTDAGLAYNSSTDTLTVTNISAALGSSTATTQSAGDNSTKVATTAYVNDAVNNIVINSQSDSYTLVLTDNGKFIDMTKGTANTLTIPANASVAFPVGAQITIRQAGAGQVTVAITSDTLNNPAATLKLRAQYSQVTITKISSTVWTIVGDLAAS